MSPLFLDGDIVIVVARQTYRTGDVVLAMQNNREVVKRIESIKGKKVYLVGDAKNESTDSRHYGPVDYGAIIGSIMTKPIRAIAPSKPLKPYAIATGRAIAGIFALMALIHLFRIDTLIPLVSYVTPGGQVGAVLIVLTIALAEVFAIPALTRIKMSPLAYAASALCAVVAPLSWLLMSIWASGQSSYVPIFGQFVATSWASSLMLSAAWLGAAIYILYLLGFTKFGFEEGRLSVKNHR